MTPALSRAYGDFLVGWVEATRRWAALTIAGAIALTAAAGYLTATRLGIDTDTAGMLSSELPFRRDYDEYKKVFPQFVDTILIVIDGASPDAAEDAGDLLAARLRRQPEVFGPVYDLAGDPLFRRNGLLYLDTDELYDLGDQLADAQPMLGTLWRDPTLEGLFHVLGLALDEGRDGAGLKIGFALESIAETAEAVARGEPAALSWRDMMAGGKSAAGEGRRFIVIKPALDFRSLQPASEAIRAVRALVDDMALTKAGTIRVRLSGPAALAEEELESVRDGMGLAGILSAILVLGLLSLGLRSPAMVFATLVTLVMGLVWTAGFAALAIGKLNLISVAFAVLFIGLSVDFGIHFALRYKEGIDRGADHATALGQAARGVGGALTLCAVAAAIGFLSFLPTDYRGLAELGLISGAGMFVALVANLTVLPAMLTLVRPSPRPAPARGPAPAGRRLVRKHSRAIIAGAVVFGAGAVLLAPHARFNFDPMALRDPATESVQVIHDLMTDSRASPYAVAVLADSLESAQGLAARLEALAEVERAVTLASYVPDDQDEKLDVIANMALFLLPAFHLTERPQSDPAERRASALAGFLDKLRALGPASPLAGPAPRLADTLEPFARGTAESLAGLERALLGNLTGRLTELRDSLSPRRLTLGDLPRELRQREVAADGRARVEIFPKEDMRDARALERFVAAVRTVAPRATGASVIIMAAGEAVIGAFYQAAATSFVLIALLTAVLLRRARHVALIFTPLVLAAALTVASTVVLDLPFNFANVIVLPLLFGLGVAGSIHLVMRERDGQGGSDVLDTSTPRAVVFSGLTTIGSFSTIALSSHPGTASMGYLLAVSISLTLVCTLVVLPALMTRFPAARD